MAIPSTDAPVSPLRQRMQHDMLMRGLGSHTRQDYVRHVRCFAAFLGRSPDTATPDDIRRFQLDQHEKGVGPATISIERGVGQLVDADMNKESTRLQALQVQQQLGIQALSIANGNSQSILSLFRG